MYRKRGLLAACKKRPERLTSALENRLPNYATQHPEPCAFDMAHLWYAFEGQPPTKTWGGTERKMCQAKVPKKAAFGTCIQAAQ